MITCILEFQLLNCKNRCWNCVIIDQGEHHEINCFKNGGTNRNWTDVKLNCTIVNQDDVIQISCARYIGLKRLVTGIWAKYCNRLYVICSISQQCNTLVSEFFLEGVRRRSEPISTDIHGKVSRVIWGEENYKWLKKFKRERSAWNQEKIFSY